MPTKISSFSLILFVSSIQLISAELPDDLDKFLEKLFETEECEEWVGDSKFISVATKDCDPKKCDFPSELCQRPASKYQDKAANQCRKLPVKCVTAANGGVPVGPPPTVAPIFTLPPPLFTLPTLPPNLENRAPFGGLLVPTPNPLIPEPPKPSPAPVNVRPRDICEMGPPAGRFCGFAQKFVYNKETFECDEFWFPGCRTEETNANLFDSRRDCERIADLCVQIEETKAARLMTTKKPHPRRVITKMPTAQGTGLLGPWPEAGSEENGPGRLGPNQGLLGAWPRSGSGSEEIGLKNGRQRPWPSPNGPEFGNGPRNGRPGQQGGLLGPWPSPNGPNRGPPPGGQGFLGPEGPNIPGPGQFPGRGAQVPPPGPDGQGGDLIGLVKQGLMAAQELKQGGNAALPKVAAQQAQTWLSQFGFEGLPGIFGHGNQRLF